MTAKRAPIAAKKPGKVRDDFTYKIGTVEIALPSMSYLKPGLIRKIRRLSDVDAMCTLLEEVLDQDALAAMDDMDPDEYEDLLEAWREHSEVTLGES